MYNLNYRLYATPKKEKRGLYDLSIICRPTVLEDWNESPREQRGTEICLEHMKTGFSIASEHGDKSIFKGYDKEAPENSLLIMEENIKMTSNGKYMYPIFRRNGFQRHEFHGAWNGTVSILHEYTQGLVSYSKKLAKKINSRKVCEKFEEFEKEALEENGGIQDYEFLKKLNRNITNLLNEE